MRLDGVEVKVNVDADQTQTAVQVLHLPDVAPWRIYFIEDVVPGLTSSTPLLDHHHLIIRARRKTQGTDDVTVKFRPARRSQLGSRWLAMKKARDGDLRSELKVEEDWAAGRRSLGISLTAERPDGLVAAAADDEGGVSALLTQDQRELIEQCAGARVNLDVLSPLPAVSAMRWPAFVVPGPGEDLNVRAERWTIQSLDFLELSIAVDVDRARASQEALEYFVASKGLRAATGEAKTSQVMQLLVATAAEPRD